MLPSWFTSWSQTFWPTSAASAASSRYRRHNDQISGAYRSTSASHASSSPFLARITRVATGWSGIGSASWARCWSADMALSCLSVPGLIASGVVALLVGVVQLADRGVRPVSRARTRGRTGDRWAVAAYR
jgi:hypothetical protein